MVAVAQLVEPRIVTPVVVGSSPISHPICQKCGAPQRAPFFVVAACVVSCVELLVRPAVVLVAWAGQHQL